MATMKKAQNGTKTTKKPKLVSSSRLSQVADSLDNVASQKAQASMNRTIGTYVKDYKDAKGYDKIAQELNKDSGRDSDNATRYRKLIEAAKKKKKMKNGGSLSAIKKAPAKRVGPVDPKGAFTKVQEKTLAGAKGKAKLTKDKQLGATKMAKRGMSIKKK